MAFRVPNKLDLMRYESSKTSAEYVICTAMRLHDYNWLAVGIAARLLLIVFPSFPSLQLACEKSYELVTAISDGERSGYSRRTILLTSVCSSLVREGAFMWATQGSPYTASFVHEVCSLRNLVVFLDSC